jgi:cysteine desulfuration protein SufE
MDLATVLDDFDALEPGDERLQHLIELGRSLPPFPEHARTEAHKVSGCLSQVWVTARREGDGIRLEGDSDALVVKGLVALLIAIYDGRLLAEAATLDPTPIFARIGLEGHLSMTRRNGLWSMVQRIRAHAAALSASG